MFVTGYSTTTVGSDFLTVAYSLKGRELWVARMNSSDAGINLDIPIDSASRDQKLFVTGLFGYRENPVPEGPSNSSDYGTRAYDIR